MWKHSDSKSIGGALKRTKRYQLEWQIKDLCKYQEDFGLTTSEGTAILHTRKIGILWILLYGIRDGYSFGSQKGLFFHILNWFISTPPAGYKSNISSSHFACLCSFRLKCSFLQYTAEAAELLTFGGHFGGFRKLHPSKSFQCSKKIEYQLCIPCLKCKFKCVIACFKCYWISLNKYHEHLAWICLK